MYVSLCQVAVDVCLKHVAWFVGGMSVQATKEATLAKVRRRFDLRKLTRRLVQSTGGGLVMLSAGTWFALWAAR